MFVGHAHSRRDGAVQAQVPLGTTFFGNNRHGIALRRGDLRRRALRRPGALRLLPAPRADLYAMRAARAFRKRDKILKFEGAITA